MITYEFTNRLADLILVKDLLHGLDDYYPDFGFWFTNRCIPGCLGGMDRLLIARDGHRIIGAALAKVGSEVKLRCVRVLPDYHARGVGIRLIEKMLRSLDCDKPYCTVAEEMLHHFTRPFINLFQFELSYVYKGMYRRGALEYVFNAPQPGKLIHVPSVVS